MTDRRAVSAVGDATLLTQANERYGRLPNYVNGEFVESSSSRVLDVINPATAQAIAEVPLATRDEVAAAVTAADGAFEEWRETPPNIRVQPLYRLKTLLEDHYEEIAQVLVKELRYAKLEGTGKIDVKSLTDDFDIEVDVSVKIRPGKKTQIKGKVERKAKR